MKLELADPDTFSIHGVAVFWVVVSIGAVAVVGIGSFGSIVLIAVICILVVIMVTVYIIIRIIFASTVIISRPIVSQMAVTPWNRVPIGLQRVRWCYAIIRWGRNLQNVVE